MTAIVIGAGSGGLTFTQGLSTVAGLLFPASGSGAGIIFQGGGGVNATVSDQGLEAFITFLGAGNLSAYPANKFLTNPATFGGAGSLSMSVTLGLAAVAGFAGTGGKQGF